MFLTYTGNLAIANCVFNANSANQAGGALSCQYDSIVTSHSSIFWGNSAPDGPEIRFRQSYDGSHPSSARVSYNLIEGGKSGISLDSDCSLLWGLGNIDADPCFVDPGYWDANGTPDDPNDDVFVEGDYHLKSQAGRWDPASLSWVQDDVTSPCIDAGDPNDPIGDEPFPNGGTINMGAYGGTAEASKSYFGQPLCQTVIAGDLNGDCTVDWADLTVLLRHWLETGTLESE